MKPSTTIQAVLILVLLILASWQFLKIDTLEEEIHELKQPSLYVIMNQLQNQSHKLFYALENQNQELVDFYIHELEESAETLIEANVEYHGQPVGELSRTMLLAPVESLEEAVDDGDWELANQRYQVLIQSCNTCHVSTGYPAIVIKQPDMENPFNQDFSVRE